MRHLKRLLVLMVCMAMVMAVPFTAEAAKIKLNKKKATQPCNTAMTVLTLKGAKKGKVKWKSTNKKVVTCDSNGSNHCILVSHKAGKAKVKAKYKGKTYTCKVTVKEKPSIETKSMEVNVGQWDYLRINGTAKKITWTVADKSIVKVSKAKRKGLVNTFEVKGLKLGKTKITAKVGKKKLSCTVTVTKEMVDDDVYHDELDDEERVSKATGEDIEDEDEDIEDDYSGPVRYDTLED